MLQVADLDADRIKADLRDKVHGVKDLLGLVMFELGDNDDPQVIFEALNGRGTPLLPSDLIKNRSLA